MQDDAHAVLHRTHFRPRDPRAETPAAFTRREDERRILWISNLQHELKNGWGWGEGEGGEEEMMREGIWD